MTYKKAGVDIDKANKLVKDMKNLISSTRIKGSLGSIGGFGGFFDPKALKIKNPILVAATDGVGTKLKIAEIADKHDTIGIDLVAMCVNDILCSAGRPLFFLDYFASGKLNEKTWVEVIKGIVKGCKDAGCVLLGGETAEMPGMYKGGEYDLAGFSVGIVDKRKVIDGKKVKAGDVILGVASSGLHSNGYSLVRKIFSPAEIKKQYKILLKPTIIYVKPFLEISQRVTIKAVAHITGGGFYDNIPRSLPKGKKAVIYKGSWQMPRVFDLIKSKTKIKEEELYRTFNMGIGMTWVLSKKDADKAKEMLTRKYKIKSWIIGEIINGKVGVAIN
ncbi:MAG: phosphoribosylformylglycinamidine cyclo-ligase [Candidatus Omnitrophota bacterium]